MLDRSFSGGLPPKWRSSLAVYAYPLPLADTEDEYPDSRIIYLKIAASITGWSPREVLDGHLLPDPSWDPWQRAAWEAISASPALSRSYWACVSAILQVSVYPRPEAGVADDDYPHIIDFEPKKRELYETVTETREALSGSSGNVNVRKGTTSTHSVELDVTAKTSIPMVGGAEVHAGYGYQRESVDITTSDSSTERRETAGRSTQLSQMYQLFNGYHVGTNRAVFAIFPRPHIVAKSAQVEHNLINGERRLEGVQDVFLVVQVPRSIQGVCVRAYLDTGHKLSVDSPGLGVGMTPQLVVTRRNVGGCGVFENDRLRAVPPPVDDTPRQPMIVGEHEVASTLPSHRRRATTGAAARVEVADDLNLGQADVRAAVLADATTGAYEPRPFIETAAFGRLASVDLRGTAVDLKTLVDSGFVSPQEEVALRRLGVETTGEIFSYEKDMPAVSTVRSRLVAALRKPADRPT